MQRIYKISHLKGGIDLSIQINKHSPSEYSITLDEEMTSVVANTLLKHNALQLVRMEPRAISNTKGSPYDTSSQTITYTGVIDVRTTDPSFTMKKIADIIREELKINVIERKPDSTDINY